MSRRVQVNNREVYETILAHFGDGKVFKKQVLLSTLRKEGKIDNEYTDKNLESHMRTLRDNGVIKNVGRGEYIYEGPRSVVREEDVSDLPLFSGVGDVMQTRNALRVKIKEIEDEIEEWSKELADLEREREERLGELSIIDNFLKVHEQIKSNNKIK